MEIQADHQANLERMAQEYRELKDKLDAIEPRMKGLRAELLQDLPAGVHTMGPVVVSIKEQKRTPTVDWKKAFVDLNGQDALDDVLARHKACADAKPVLVLSVEWLSGDGKKKETPDEF